VAGELDEWCMPLRLTLEASSVTSFYIDLAAREGLRRRTPGPLEGRVLFLDTRPLHAVLMQNVIMLEQKIKGQPLSDRTPRRSEQLGLMTKLASQVDPEFKPFARRGERTAAAGAVDAIVGFAKICAFLKEEERDPIPLLEPGKSFGGTMELAVFGRMRNERDRRLDMTRRRLAAFSAPGGPWEVKDVSQTGFRLGMQVIANTLVGVDLVEQRKHADNDYSVDGEQTTINGRTFQGLFLTLRKRETDVGVQSLIVPVSEFQPANRLKLMTARSINPIRYGRLIEQQPDWVWATVEPLDLHHSTSAMTIGGLPPAARAVK
jgi:hypothetical protein